MANGADASPGLTFSRDTFAKLTPAPFLHAHLKQPATIRPNGRSPDESRKPAINTGSLTHSNGSAVVRIGNTAIVCGVRAEILLAKDIPHPPNEDADEDDLAEDLGLLVPNVELSTGCSPAHLPGNPPGTQAQALSYRLLSLLHTARLFSPTDLRVSYTEPPTDDDLPDAGPGFVTKAYWVLYIDILCISLDGNAFDAAWAAVMAAFRDTMLPRAWWDSDQERIVCSPLAAEASRLRLRDFPVALSFAVFVTASPLKMKGEAECWILADPDAFEEEICQEVLTLVVSFSGDGGLRVLGVEKSGGAAIGARVVEACVGLAEKRWRDWDAVFNR